MLAVVAEQEAKPVYVGAEVGGVVAGASDEPGEGGFGPVVGGQPLLVAQGCGGVGDGCGGVARVDGDADFFAGLADGAVDD